MPELNGIGSPQTPLSLRQTQTRVPTRNSNDVNFRSATSTPTMPPSSYTSKTSQASQKYTPNNIEPASGAKKYVIAEAGKVHKDMPQNVFVNASQILHIMNKTGDTPFVCKRKATKSVPFITKDNPPDITQSKFSQVDAFKLVKNGSASIPEDNNYYVNLKPEVFITGLFKDDSGVIRSYDSQFDIIMQICQKAGLKINNLPKDFTLVGQYHEDGFKDGMFQTFTDASTVEKTEIKDGTKNPNRNAHKTYETQETAVYTTCKRAIIYGKKGFSPDAKIEGKHPYDYLGTGHIKLNSNYPEIAQKIENAINSHPDIMPKINAVKILSLATGEQINFKELIVILTGAAMIGVAGEMAGDAIKHAIMHDSHSLGLAVIAAIPKAAAVYLVDLLENTINAWAITDAELKKRGIQKITGKLVFGDKYDNWSAPQKFTAWFTLMTKGNKEADATGRLGKYIGNKTAVFGKQWEEWSKKPAVEKSKDIIAAAKSALQSYNLLPATQAEKEAINKKAEGALGPTVGNLLHSAFAGAGLGVVLSFLPLVLLTRDYKEESFGQMFAINATCTAVAAFCTGISIPIELRNILDRTLATMSNLYNSFINGEINATTLNAKIQDIVKEVKETITTSVASKSSIKAFLSVWTLGFVWLLHPILGDKATSTIMMALLAPFENIWRAAYVGADMMVAESNKSALRKDALKSILEEKQLPDNIVQSHLTGNFTKLMVRMFTAGQYDTHGKDISITNSALLPILDNLSSGVSNAKYAVDVVYNKFLDLAIGGFERETTGSLQNPYKEKGDTRPRKNIDYDGKFLNTATTTTTDTSNDMSVIRRRTNFARVGTQRDQKASMTSNRTYTGEMA
ncbi:MAG: hypothetical protein RLZZ210_525 [Pseudomonadota bacterium]|jgi:hypothetical protein